MDIEWSIFAAPKSGHGRWIERMLVRSTLKRIGQDRSNAAED
jgi:hypothetical protein